jgi:C_GCAxxG_C_C family probable redox protein
MDEILERVIELSQRKYVCSQIMLLLGQDMHQNENEGLIRAMSGLGGGMFTRKACGTLTGGCCLLASYVAGEVNEEERTAKSKAMVTEFVDWFENTYKCVQCEELVSEDTQDRARICPHIVHDSFVKCMEILSEHGYDPYEQ